MMEKEKRYEGTKFSTRIMRAAVDKLTSLLPGEKYSMNMGRVTIGDERWTFDDIEDFFTACEHDRAGETNLSVGWDRTRTGLSALTYDGRTTVTVKSASRRHIETVFAIFDEAAAPDKISLPRDERGARPTVVIGHGQDKQWEKLRSHLQDKHQLNVISYETGARSGHAIRDVFDGMARRLSLALFVLTDEDRTKEGVRARQHVIHECGLFQGRLGFDRAILIVEQSIKLPSNFDGIQQLRFEAGRISETFADVISAIKREFGPAWQAG